jgi:D-serine dehydratase
VIKVLQSWFDRNSIIKDLVDLKDVFWSNPNYNPLQTKHEAKLNLEDIQDAEERLKRFAPYIVSVFPETRLSNGIIESPVTKIPLMKQKLEEIYEQKLLGDFLLKCDSYLPISGSIKARGGIYEVLKHAELLALKHGLITLESDYSIMDSEEFRSFFSNYSIAVGSTGNLGLSIGIMSAKLGFKVTVHMSSDAKMWKKDLLKSKGVTVVEYKEDYSKAVEEGRRQASSDPNCYFIDDENSQDLFLGYAVAAIRIKQQLEELNVTVDENHPLFVYLPCGVGGGPGGVAFGLKQMYHKNVHCFFAEPTHSPCMLLGLVTGMYDQVSVQDFGIDNITSADGLAVGRPSGFVGKIIEPLLSGCYTVTDEELFKLLSLMIDTEAISLEPSALAGVIGPVQLWTKEEGKEYIQNHSLKDKMNNATHLMWATGGSMVPKEMMVEYYQKGKSLLAFK